MSGEAHLHRKVVGSLSLGSLPTCNIQFKDSRKYYEEKGLEIAEKLQTGDFIGWEDDLSDAFPYQILQATKEPYSVGSAKLRSVTPWDDEERAFKRGEFQVAFNEARKSERRKR